MRKLRVGIWLTETIKPDKGGGFSYYTELANAIRGHSFKDAEIVLISKETLKNKLPGSPAYKLLAKALKRSPLRQHLDKRENVLRKELSASVDILYYLTPDCPYTGFPFIYTHWDIAHLSTHAFPEFSMSGNFEYRREQSTTVPHKALAIFAPSEEGRRECLRYLNVNEEKVHTIPIFPSGVIHGSCIAQRPLLFKGDEDFIHYPAQYWAHKNHFNLIHALAILIKEFPGLKLALTGSDKGNKAYIFQTIRELGLEENVMDLGFVSNNELRWLYERSLGLVMPTFLGTVNMPLLEAAELGCPVSCTDMPGHRELLGGYGYYFDSTDPNDIAIKVAIMIRDKRNGTKKPYRSSFTIESALLALDEAFTKISRVRFCWP